MKVKISANLELVMYFIPTLHLSPFLNLAMILNLISSNYVIKEN